jgi:hypothetical protein
MFFVVVVSLIAIHTAHSEILLHRLQALNALRTLCNYKLMSHLESSSSLVDSIDEAAARRGLKNIPRHRQNR